MAGRRHNHVLFRYPPACNPSKTSPGRTWPSTSCLCYQPSPTSCKNSAAPSMTSATPSWPSGYAPVDLTDPRHPRGADCASTCSAALPRLTGNSPRAAGPKSRSAWASHRTHERRQHGFDSACRHRDGRRGRPRFASGGITKQYGVGSRVTQPTVEADPVHAFMKIDDVRVKGQEKPVAHL